MSHVNALRSKGDRFKAAFPEFDMPKPYRTRSPEALFQPTQAGALELSNRVVMAPLTRNRAGPGLVPSEYAAEYYAQRSTAGLIIAEATQISAQAQGYADTPGCYTDAQVAGWRKVTEAVDAKRGTIVLQLWHTGRVSHTMFQMDGVAPVGPSAIRRTRRPLSLAKASSMYRRLVRLSFPRFPASLVTSETPQDARLKPDLTVSNFTARMAIYSTLFCGTAAIIAPTRMAGRSRTERA
jgi:hypothetical protein